MNFALRLAPTASSVAFAALIWSTVTACNSTTPNPTPLEAGADDSATSLGCPTPQTICGSLCTTPSQDPTNCGTCGNACPAGNVCLKGECALSCNGGTSVCGTACVDLQSDTQHCGQCDVACTGGQVCSQGSCTLTCVGGTTDCSGSCVNVDGDRANCGVCGTICAAGQVCSNGSCQASCSAPSTACVVTSDADAGGDAGVASTICANLTNDPNNCNGCGVSCPSGSHSVAACIASSCALVCASGYADCDSDPATGCETSITTSQNCGACGNACPNSGACLEGNLCSAQTVTSTHSAQTVLPGCANPAPSTSRTTAVDAAGVLYVAGVCGTAIEVTRSENGGATWSTPVALPGLTVSAPLTMQLLGGNAGGTLIVFLIDGTGIATASLSTDAAATFASPVTIQTNVLARLPDASLADRYYVGFEDKTSGNISMYASDDGATWELTAGGSS